MQEGARNDRIKVIRWYGQRLSESASKLKKLGTHGEGQGIEALRRVESYDPDSRIGLGEGELYELLGGHGWWDGCCARGGGGGRLVRREQGGDVDAIDDDIVDGWAS
jgi:hypothetical protein